MKTTIIIFLFYSLAVAQPKPQDLFDNMQAATLTDNARATLVQRITTTSGSIRELTYESYSTNNGEKSIMRYVSPSRVKGNAMLTTDHSNNIWMFNNRTNRVRKLASHAKKQKFEGSDFTYEDMGSGDTWSENYTPVQVTAGKIDKTLCWILDLQSQNADAGYSKISCWVRQTDNYPLQFDYYNENKTLFKSLYFSNISVIEGKTTAQKYVMFNHIDKTQTEMQYINITFDVTFPDYFFSERNLRN